MLDAQKGLNILCSVSRYLIWINSESICETSAITQATFAAYIDEHHGRYDLETAQEYAEKWEQISRYCELRQQQMLERVLQPA